MAISTSDMLGFIVGAEGLLVVLMGLLTTALCVLIFRGSLKRNSIAGFRLKKALESEENWQKINGYGARLMFIPSLITILCGLLIIYYRNTSPGLAAPVLVLVILLIMVPVVVTIMYANRL